MISVALRKIESLCLESRGFLLFEGHLKTIEAILVLQENGYIMQPMKLITSAQNDRLKYLSKLLSQAKARRASGQTVLEGVHLAAAGNPCVDCGVA